MGEQSYVQLGGCVRATACGRPGCVVAAGWRPAGGQSGRACPDISQVGSGSGGDAGARKAIQRRAAGIAGTQADKNN